MTIEFTGFEGVRLVGDAWGDDDAWPVLFMHGGGQTRHAWGGTCEQVAEHGWRAVSIDLRGHGDSAWAANGDYSFATFAADALAVADALGRPPVLVGASLGGVAALMAEGLTDRVVSSALVIVDITTGANRTGLERIRDFMQSGLDGFATLDDAAAAIAAYTPQRQRSFNPDGLKKVLRQHDDGRWYWHWDPAFLARGRREIPAPRYQAAFEASLEGVHVPALLVRGVLSDVVTQEGVDTFLSRVQGSKLADVRDAAHMVAGDQNDAFTDAVVTFLEHDIRPILPA